MEKHKALIIVSRATERSERLRMAIRLEPQFRRRLSGMARTKSVEES